MSWEDDPVVGQPSSWQNDPVVGDAKSSISPAYDTARQMMGVYAPLADMGAGAKQGWDALAQMAARATGWQVPQTEAAMTPKPTDTSLGASLARGVGQSLWTLPAAGLKVLAAAPKVLQGMALGGASGVLEPVYEPQSNEDFWQRKRSQAGLGALAGGGTTAVTSVIGRMLAPKTSEAVKTLLKEGVTPSLGQIAGGATQRFEDSTKSVLGLGAMVDQTQRRAIGQFNKALYARALTPLGPEAQTFAAKLPAGHEGLAKTAGYLSDAYEAALDKSVPNVVSKEFGTALDNVAAMVPQSKRGDFVDTIRNVVIEKITPEGTLTPSVAKEAESRLGQLFRTYIGSNDGDQRLLAGAYSQARSEIRKLVAQNNPTVAPTLRAIDRGYATLAQIETAAGKVGAKEGIITPAQFLNAVNKHDPTIRKTAFGFGTALNQDFAEAGKKVLSETMPETGARVIPTALAGLILHYTGGWPLAAAGSLAYTPFGQRLVADALTSRTPGMIAAGQNLGKLSPYLAAPFAAGLLGP